MLFSCDNKAASIDTFSVLGKAEMYKVVTDKGWALLSSETSITPILAYSYEGDFPSVDDMPDGMKWLFSYYEEAIQQARLRQDELKHINAWDDSNNPEKSIASADTTVILARLGNIEWGQGQNNDFNCGKAYNKFCPDFYPKQCNRNLVGCGAVALGQVLQYYQWPYYASIPTAMLDSFGTVSQQETYKHYDWSMMPNAIYSWTTTSKADSTASFLKDCGFSILTEYRYDGSSSTFVNTVNALQNRFDYTTAYALSRNSQQSNWLDLMKNEIRNGRPVLYRGSNSANGGHAFILYGFEGDKFLINWGWSGEFNYVRCSLDSLCYYPGYGYPYNQAAIIGIEPSYSYCPIQGEDTLCSSNTYSLVGIPSTATISWSYETAIQQVDTFPVLTLSGTSSSSITVQRGSHYSLTFNGVPVDEELYSGVVTLKATVTFSGVTKIFTKYILLHEDKLPTLPISQQRKIGLNETRTFTINNCWGVPYNKLKWRIHKPLETDTITNYGYNWTITASIPDVNDGIMNIRLYNLENCDPSAYTNYNIRIDYHQIIDPFDPLLLFPNPVTTNTVEIQVVDKSYADRGSNETAEERPAIEYTLELWDENYGLLKTVNSSISGEKDIVTLDVSNLNNGIYFLVLKVDKEILSTSKMIINK